MADLLPVPKHQFFDDDGNPLANGLIYTYEAGGVTPKATYTTAAGDVEHQNPIQLDPAGRAAIYINAESYKFVIKDADLNIISTTDNLTLPSVAALASAFYRDVVYITSSDSPYAIASTHNGKLIVADTSGGAIAVTLPEISGVDLPFNIAFLLRTAGNNLTMTRAGSDTIMGATSKVISAAGVGCQFAGDDGKSPDDWSVIEFGTVADNAVTTAKILDANVTRAKLATGAVAKATVRSVITTDSPSVSADDTLVLSGASFTSTLPTAVGNSGKIFEFLHNGTSLSQVYTLATTSAQTIGGIASGSYALYTNGESLKVMSDGANWMIINSRTRTAWASYTPASYQGIGTPTNVNFRWRRDATDILISAYGTLGTNTAAEMRADLPANVTSHSSLPTLQICGNFGQSTVAADHYDVVLIEASKTYMTFGAQYSSNFAALSKINGNFFSNGANISFQARIHVAGWQP